MLFNLVHFMCSCRIGNVFQLVVALCKPCFQGTSSKILALAEAFWNCSQTGTCVNSGIQSTRSIQSFYQLSKGSSTHVRKRYGTWNYRMHRSWPCHRVSSLSRDWVPNIQFSRTIKWQAMDWIMKKAWIWTSWAGEACLTKLIPLKINHQLLN